MVIGFIGVLTWCYLLHDRLVNLELSIESETNLSDIMWRWDELYADSDKHQKRQMTIDRQKYGIKTAAQMRGIGNE
jgi:predicted DsbA family dithiol-disulfide isomerase